MNRVVKGFTITGVVMASIIVLLAVIAVGALAFMLFSLGC